MGLEQTVKNALLRLKVAGEPRVPSDKLRNFLTACAPVGLETPLIRVGPDGDGGYVLPDDLEGITACFSPGVDFTAGFEEDIARRGIPCYLADYSVDGPPIDNPRFHFQKKYLGSRSDDILIRLEDWVAETVGDAAGDFLLQMDIEGAEYGVLLDTPVPMLKRFRIIVLELHHCDLLFSRSGHDRVAEPILKLLDHFSIVHIHPNNRYPPVSDGKVSIPPLLEFTFLRKDRIRPGPAPSTYPLDVDSPNVAKRPDIPLHPSWYEV